MSQGIYAIVNDEQRKLYVGQSQDISNRWNTHVEELDKGVHQNPGLQADWKSFGSDAFTFCILQEVEDYKDLLIEEREYLSYLGDEFELYNVAWIDRRPRQPQRKQTDLPRCRECGGAMKAFRSTKSTCSDRCRTRAYRRRLSEK